MNLATDDRLYGEMFQLRAVAGLEPEISAERASELGSARRAPALAGLTLLDQVSREVIQARADPDDRDGDGISGRLPAGRFGWKAQVASLREQVARALSLDLGLSTSLFPSAAGDCTPQQQACREAARAVTGAAFEAPDVVLDLLIAYLGGLPVPASPAATGEGAALFTSLGCESCHTAAFAGTTLRPFTDLLLHDLGPELAGGSDPEWRTAPLWGLRETGPFLHDGRATSLGDAILWHGGEASRAREAYRALNSPQRAILHGWLLGL